MTRPAGEVPAAPRHCAGCGGRLSDADIYLHSTHHADCQPNAAGPPVTETEWMRRNGLTRSTAAPCAHTLRGRRCPTDPGCLGLNTQLLDHGALYLRDSRPAVILAHPYDLTNDKLRDLLAYATAHRLTAHVGSTDDAFYGYGTSPVRLTPEEATR